MPNKRKDAGDTIANVIAIDGAKTEMNLRLGEWLRMMAAHADSGRIESWCFIAMVEGVSTRWYGPKLPEAALLAMQVSTSIVDSTRGPGGGSGR